MEPFVDTASAFSRLALNTAAASSFSPFKEFLKQFKVLASLQDGERIHITESGITSKYQKPTNTVASAFQAVVRAQMAQNTSNALITIRELARKTVVCLSNLTILELITGYGEKINLLYKLKQRVEIFVGFFPTFKATCTQGTSNFIALKGQAIQAREQLAEEVLTHLTDLSTQVSAKIGEFEMFNLSSDTTHCDRFYEILTDPNPAQKIQILYPKGGLPTEVCSKAAQSVLNSLFGPDLIKRVYKLYKLEFKGMLRMQDFYSLMIGAAAHYTPVDLETQRRQNNPIFQQLQNTALESILNTLRNMPLMDITPLKCYKSIFERDIDFLGAHKKAQNYKAANEHITQAGRFRQLEYEMYDLLPVFVKNPHCDPTSGLLFYSYDTHEAPKCLQAIPIISENELSCLAIRQVTESNPSVLHILLPNTDVAIPKEALQALMGAKRCILEIVATASSCSRAISSLLSLVPDNAIDAVNFYFFGPAHVTHAVREQFMQIVESHESIKFTLRYFLEHTKSFPQTVDVYLGAQIAKLTKTSNLNITLLKFARDQKYTDPTPLPERWFSITDERDRNNLTYIAEIKTTNKEDLHICQGFEEKRICPEASYQLINHELSPGAPPKSGWFG